MNRPLRITLLTDGITPFVTGGMQRHSANLAKYFTKIGVEVTLVHCVPHNSKLPSEKTVNESLFGEGNERLEKIFLLKFPKSGKIPGHYIRNSYAYSEYIFNQLDFSACDFVYAKGFCGWYYMEQKRKGVRLPPIGVKFHGYEMYQDLPSIRQKIESLILRKATRFNNQNADVVFSYGGKITSLIEEKLNISRGKILEFTSGLDSDWEIKQENKATEGPVNFIFIGRDEIRKGMNELKIVLNNLKEKKDFEFHFVGPISKGKRIQHDSIIYHGELNSKNEICAVLDKMEVLVCPSHAEGMPNVILEGMARSLAILATDVGAVEILVDSSNGILIERLQQGQLEDALIKFIQMDKDELSAKKKASLEKVKSTFLWNRVIEKTTEAILELTKNKFKVL